MDAYLGLECFVFRLDNTAAALNKQLDSVLPTDD